MSLCVSNCSSLSDRTGIRTCVSRSSFDFTIVTRVFGLEAVLHWEEFCACRWVSHVGLCETRWLR
jgi:hypothetical protein